MNPDHREGAAGRSIALSSAPPDERSPSILVVDDVPANLQVLTGMLKERGYRARPAPSGKLALLAARKDPPDLILLDINMPEMDGYEVCRLLKVDEALRKIPVIFISALNEGLDKVRAFAIGGVDYLTKPFQMEELHARVETHLKLRRLQVAVERSHASLEQANARMRRDLAAAAKIQQAFLPRAAVDIPGARFAWGVQPCDELAGDGLNIIPLGVGVVGLYVLDVSGHGVASALLSVSISRLLAAPADDASILVKRHPDPDPGAVTPPAAVADRLNRLFPYDTATEQFATLMYGVLDIAGGIFRYVAAGHPGPLYLPAAGPPVLLEVPGSPVGLADEGYSGRSLTLAAGDRLYLYSDGLPDAMNPEGERFGDARLWEAIDRGRNHPLAEGIALLIGVIDRWHGGLSPQDDISILAVEFTGAP